MKNVKKSSPSHTILQILGWSVFKGAKFSVNKLNIECGPPSKKSKFKKWKIKKSKIKKSKIKKSKIKKSKIENQKIENQKLKNRKSKNRKSKNQKSKINKSHTTIQIWVRVYVSVCMSVCVYAWVSVCVWGGDEWVQSVLEWWTIFHTHGSLQHRQYFIHMETIPPISTDIIVGTFFVCFFVSFPYCI